MDEPKEDVKESVKDALALNVTLKSNIDLPKEKEKQQETTSLENIATEKGQDDVKLIAPTLQLREDVNAGMKVEEVPSNDGTKPEIGGDVLKEVLMAKQPNGNENEAEKSESQEENKGNEEKETAEAKVTDIVSKEAAPDKVKEEAEKSPISAEEGPANKEEEEKKEAIKEEPQQVPEETDEKEFPELEDDFVKANEEEEKRETGDKIESPKADDKLTKNKEEEEKKEEKTESPKADDVLAKNKEEEEKKEENTESPKLDGDLVKEVLTNKEEEEKKEEKTESPKAEDESTKNKEEEEKKEADESPKADDELAKNKEEEEKKEEKTESPKLDGDLVKDVLMNKEEEEKKEADELPAKNKKEESKMNTNLIKDALLGTENQGEQKDTKDEPTLTEDVILNALGGESEEKSTNPNGLAVEVILSLDFPEEESEELAQNVDEGNETQPVFETDTPPALLNRKKTKATPQIVKPRCQSQQNNPEGPYRKSRGISIDNYDPNTKRPFTDPLTNEAMRNIGVTLDELFYPSNRDLYNYTRDKDMREVVRQQLTERVKRTQEAVRDERDRLAYKPPTPEGSARDEKLEQMTTRTKEYADMERERLARIKEKNKKEAEQIILSILIEREMIEETLDFQEKEKQAKLKHDEEVRIKKKQQHERQLQRIKEVEAQDIEIAKENERKRKEALEQEKRFEARKAEIEKNKREYYEKLDAERAKKNEEAKRIAQEFEGKRRRDYLEQQKQQTEREKEWREKKRKEQEEREERARLEEQRKAERAAVVRSNQLETLRRKREQTQMKADKQQAAYQEIVANRKHELEQQRIMHEEKERRSKETREQKYQDHEAEKKRKFEEHEERSVRYYKETQEEKDRTRRQIALEQHIKREEAKLVSNRRAKRKETDILEIQRQYEARLRMLDQKEQMRRKQQVESQMQREKLEREKYELEAGLVSTSEVRKTGTGGLKKLADKLGIDFAVLQEKAKEARRGKREERLRSSLPPVRPGAVSAAGTNLAETTK